MEKKMENEMDTGYMQGGYRLSLIATWTFYSWSQEMQRRGFEEQDLRGPTENGNSNGIVNEI